MNLLLFITIYIVTYGNKKVNTYNNLLRSMRIEPPIKERFYAADMNLKKRIQNSE